MRLRRWRFALLLWSLSAAAAQPERVRVIDVGSNSTQVHRFAEGAYVVVKSIPGQREGWFKSYGANLSDVALACAGGAACEGRVVGENHRLEEDVLVSVCKRSKTDACPRETVALAPRAQDDLATVCVPGLREGYLEPGFAPYLEAFLAYYEEQQKVKHAYVYGFVDPPKWMNNLKHAAALTWVKIGFPTDQFWYFGQNWVVQDCIHRAAAAGFQHVLSLDLDEFLNFADPLLDIPTYADKFLQPRAHQRSLDVVTFGSTAETLRSPCGDTASLCHAPPPAYENISCHVPDSPTCAVKEKRDWRLCGGGCGHRKHLVYAPRILTANIHFASHCKSEQHSQSGACNRHIETTDRAYLRHFHHEDLTRSLCPACLRW